MIGMKMLLLGAVILTAALAMVARLRYMTAVPGRPHSGPLPALTAEEEGLARRLGAHIAAIASRPHNIRHYAELEQAARYIESELATLGYAPSAQVFNVDGRDVRNIEAVIEPADPARLRGTVVVGAHYDSFGDAPGANDNGSGTAAILELAPCSATCAAAPTCAFVSCCS
jgi:Peptidase family M28